MFRFPLSLIIDKQLQPHSYSVRPLYLFITHSIYNTENSGWKKTLKQWRSEDKCLPRSAIKMPPFPPLKLLTEFKMNVNKVSCLDIRNRKAYWISITMKHSHTELYFVFHCWKEIKYCFSAGRHISHHYSSYFFCFLCICIHGPGILCQTFVPVGL